MKDRDEKINLMDGNWQLGVTVVTDLLAFPQCVLGFNAEEANNAKIKRMNVLFSQHQQPIITRTKYNNTRELLDTEGARLEKLSM
jgi:hypothetical protein